MEALYSALEGEISTFVRHMQWCQDFDLRSPYHMLLLVLPQNPSGQVESWQHLLWLAHCQPSSASPDMASSYVNWLAFYLQPLSTFKERFDTTAPWQQPTPGAASDQPQEGDYSVLPAVAPRRA